MTAPWQPRLIEIPLWRSPGTGGVLATWSLGADPVDAVAAGAMRDDHPDSAATAEPWAVAVCRPDGRVVVAVALSFTGGLYWAIDPATPTDPAEPRLLISDNPAPIVTAYRGRVDLDEDYLAAYTVLRSPPDRSPYRQIHRIAPGTTAIWRPGDTRPQQVVGCGPELWPQPRTLVPDVVARYLATFDAALARMTHGSGPVAVSMSGGLDSTFVVGSLAATTQRRIVAFCHSPHPDAQLVARGGWDPDDFDVAASLDQAYPGRIDLRRVVNVDRRQLLDVARAHSVRSWLPVYNPGNQVWMELIAEQSAALGADRLLLGTHGNAAFSWHGGPALSRHLAQHQWRLAAAVLGGARGPDERLSGRIRKRVVSPVVGPWYRRLRTRSAPAAVPVLTRVLGISDVQPRDAYDPDLLADWLAMRSGLAAAAGPTGWPTPMADPFASAAVVSLAATIPAAQWAHGPHDRGLARTLGIGRVPDAVRLRTRRGGQSWDSWFTAKDERDRYLAEVDQLSDTPVVGDLVDPAVVRQVVTGWPWGDPLHPQRQEWVVTTRVLVFAEFVRMTAARLAEPRVTPSPGRPQVPSG